MNAAAMGFAMPPEWAEQQAVWLSWPVADERHWAGQKSDLMGRKFAEIASVISRFETVRINASAHRHEMIRRLCSDAKADPKHIEFFDHPNNDVWCRDHGPIFVKHHET